ncbi:MAG: hypothetical protein HMLKMBBP_03080 [Planctomycetes bacterium]|nr:hypothetical protein [Planctomycetota bacterium]
MGRLAKLTSRAAAVAVAAAVALAAPHRGAEAQDRVADETLGFDRSVELLETVLELRALRTLSQRGFYVPTPLWREYADRAASLSKELSVASDRDLAPIAAWLQERKRTAKAEVALWQEVFVGVGSAAFRGVKLVDRRDAVASSAGGKGDAANPGMATQTDLSIQSLARARADWEKAALTAAAADLRSALRSFDDSLAAVKDNILLGRSEGAPGMLERLSRTMQRDQRAANSTRERLVVVEQARARADAAAAALDRLDRGVKILEFMQGSNVSRVAQVTTEVAKEAMKEYYGQGFGVHEEANLKWAIGIGKSLATRLVAAGDATAPLADDPAMRGHPETLRMARQFAGVAAAFGFVGDTLKSLDAAAPIAPLFDVIDFYGKALGTVAECARVMQGLVDKADGEALGGRLGSPFRGLPGGVGELWSTPLHQAMGIPVACTHTNMDDATARFLLVIRPGAADGYVSLTREEYDRLAAAIADERIVNAASEASRGFFDAFADRVTHTRGSPVRPDAGSTYLSNLRSAARTVPFPPSSCADLARTGSGVTDEGLLRSNKVWRADQLAELRRAELLRLAGELVVREALGGPYEHAAALDWIEFLTEMRREQAVLAPDQMVNLFGFWHLNRGGRDRLVATLRRIAEERRVRALGTIRAGWGAIAALPHFSHVRPGRPATLSASFLVGDMAPGRTSQGTVEWELPSWAGGRQTEAVTLRNGLLKVNRQVAVPKEGVTSFECSARLRWRERDAQGKEEERSAGGTERFVVSEPPRSEPVAWKLRAGYPKPDENLKWHHENTTNRMGGGRISVAPMHGVVCELTYTEPPTRLVAGETCRLSITGVSSTHPEEPNGWVAGGIGSDARGTSPNDGPGRHREPGATHLVTPPMKLSDARSLTSDSIEFVVPQPTRGATFHVYVSFSVNGWISLIYEYEPEEPAE